MSLISILSPSLLGLITDLSDEDKKKKAAQAGAQVGAAVAPDQSSGDPAAEVRADVSNELQNPQVAANVPPQPSPQPQTQVPPMPAPQPVAMGPTPQMAPTTVGSQVVPTVHPNVPPTADKPKQDVGLLGRLLGYGDQTPDASGLTRSDRSQLGFGALAQLGGLLLAAGQPMAPAQRAQYLAAMGQIPGQMQETRAALLKNHMGVQQMQTQAQKLDAIKAMQAQANDPATLAGLTPAQRTILQGALTMGDLATAERMLDPAKNRVKSDANGNLFFPDGSVRDAMGNVIVAAGGQSVPQNAGHNGVGVNRDQVLAPSPVKTRDDAFLAQLYEQNPAMAQQVRNFADYKVPFPVSARTAALANPNSPQARMLGMITSYAPDWKQSDFANQQKLWNEFYGSGKTASNITALDTAYGHLGDLYDAASALKTGNSQAINAITNKIKTQLGDPSINNAAMAANAVSHELASVFRQTGMSEGEIKDWESQLSPNMSPAQMQNAIVLAQKLMQSRVDSLMTRYQRAGGSTDGANWFTPSHTDKANYIKSHPLDAPQVQAGQTQGAPQVDRSALEAEMRRRGIIK